MLEVQNEGLDRLSEDQVITLPDLAQDTHAKLK